MRERWVFVIYGLRGRISAPVVAAGSKAAMVAARRLLGREPFEDAVFEERYLVEASP